MFNPLHQLGPQQRRAKQLIFKRTVGNRKRVGMFILESDERVFSGCPGVVQYMFMGNPNALIPVWRGGGEKIDEVRGVDNNGNLMGDADELPCPFLASFKRASEVLAALLDNLDGFEG